MNFIGSASALAIQVYTWRVSRADKRRNKLDGHHTRRLSIKEHSRWIARRSCSKRRASHRLVRHGADLPVHDRPLHRLYDPSLGQGAISLGALRRGRRDSALAASQPNHERWLRRIPRRHGTLCGVGSLSDRHQVPSAAAERADPAHLLDRHWLCAVPHRHPGKPSPDRQIIPRPFVRDCRGLSTRTVRRLSASERRRSQGTVQPGHVRKRRAGLDVLQPRPTEVLRLRTVGCDLVLHAIHFFVDGGEPVALEAGGLLGACEHRIVGHPGANAAADAATDPALHDVPGQPQGGPVGLSAVY